MFEGIRFYHLNLNKSADSRQMRTIVEHSEVPETPAQFSRYYQCQSEDFSFLLQGDNKVIYPHPLTDYAQKHFLYLQTFGLLDAAPVFFTKRRNYRSILILYTYEGQGELVYEGKNYLLSENSGFLIDCMKPHYYHTTDTHWKHAVLHFYGTDAPYLADKYFLDSKCPLFHCQQDSLFQEKLESVIRTSEQPSPMLEYNVSLALGNLVSFLISEHGKSSKHTPDYIIYLQKYLDNNYTNNFTLDDLAEFSSMSKYHLVREFKKYIGFSPIDYLIELRIERAKFLLKNSAFSIEEIAFISGFSSYANFLKIFKSKLQQTPAEYRG